MCADLRTECRTSSGCVFALWSLKRHKGCIIPCETRRETCRHSPLSFKSPTIHNPTRETGLYPTGSEAHFTLNAAVDIWFSLVIYLYRCIRRVWRTRLFFCLMRLVVFRHLRLQPLRERLSECCCCGSLSSRSS